MTVTVHVPCVLIRIHSCRPPPPPPGLSLYTPPPKPTKTHPQHYSPKLIKSIPKLYSSNLMMKKALLRKMTTKLGGENWQNHVGLLFAKIAYTPFRAEIKLSKSKYKLVWPRI